jgi:hypothetical protein
VLSRNLSSSLRGGIPFAVLLLCMLSKDAEQSFIVAGAKMETNPGGENRVWLPEPFWFRRFRRATFSGTVRCALHGHWTLATSLDRGIRWPKRARDVEDGTHAVALAHILCFQSHSADSKISRGTRAVCDTANSRMIGNLPPIHPHLADQQQPSSTSAHVFLPCHTA